MTAPHATPTLFESDKGPLSVRVGEHALEDPVDPWLGAGMFASAEQVERGDHVIVFGAGLGYRLRHLASIGCEAPIVYEPCGALVDLARERGVGIPPGAQVFTDLEALHKHLHAVTKPKENTILLAPMPYRRAFPEAFEQLGRTINEVQGLVLLQRNSVMERAGMLAERAIGNLPRLAAVPTLGELGRPLEGSPAFVVSAGPSLDRNRQHLVAAAARGPVFAVNTSAPVLATIGAPIDLLVAIEALDVTEPITKAAPVTRALALDLTSGFANFDAPVERKVTFMVDAPQYRDLADRVGIGTLGYGGSVATAAFAIAHALGADPIVLVGQDLAYTDGRGYAEHTLYEATRVYRDGALIYIDRAKKWDETTAAGGLKVPSKVRPVVDVTAWGGEGEVWSTHELVLFRRWFEMATEQIDGGTRLINATEGGARVAGFEELPLAEVLAQLPERSHGLHAAIDAARRVPQTKITRAAQDVMRASNRLARCASRALKANGGRNRAAVERAERELRAAGRKAPLAESHAGPALLEILDDEALTLRDRTSKTFEAIRRSAHRVEELARAASQPLG